MSIIFSRACEYGIQATLYIATQGGRRVGIREIAHELRIPVHFLAKILQSLSTRGILDSFKGATGGYTLHDAPVNITLIDIVAAIDGLEMFSHCILGFEGCGSGKPCPVHDKWGEMRSNIRRMLSEQTLEEIIPVSREKIASLFTTAA